MSWSLSWPSERFLQSQDLRMLTCFCVMFPAVPQTGVAGEADLKKLTGLDTLSPRPLPHGPEDQLEIRMGELSANPYTFS